MKTTIALIVLFFLISCGGGGSGGSESTGIAKGEIIENAADNNTAYTWYYYIPTTLAKGEKAYIVINSIQYDCDKNLNDEETYSNIDGIKSLAESHKYILLFASIPKYCSGGADEYTLHFPDYVFDANTIDEIFYRPDLKVIAMIDLLRAELANSGYTVDQKVFAFGYSIGGHFSNRFSLLQPNRVKAFAAGGLSGLITLPITSYSNEDFYWYFGVSNFDALAGDTFNYSAYESIPQYYFWGENDLSPYHLDS
ncbi:MAG: hypothetical protein P8X55_03835 [Desulfosarcinaceae bacterium]